VKVIFLDRVIIFFFTKYDSSGYSAYKRIKIKLSKNQTLLDILYFILIYI